MGIVTLLVASQQSKKHQHHGGAICQCSGLAMVNQPTPPPGASAEGVGQGRCVRVSFNLADWPREKKSIHIKFILLICNPSISSPSKQCSSTPCTPSHGCISSPFPLPPCPHVFLLVVACIHQTVAIKDNKVIFFIFFHCSV